MLVMTSIENHEETVHHFKSNAWFGGSEQNFIFFPQKMLPAINNSGKILMQSPFELKLAPNGNGGFFAACATDPTVKSHLEAMDYV